MKADGTMGASLRAGSAAVAQTFIDSHHAASLVSSDRFFRANACAEKNVTLLTDEDGLHHLAAQHVNPGKLRAALPLPAQGAGGLAQMAGTALL
jgi:hypothetical protein